MHRRETNDLEGRRKTRIANDNGELENVIPLAPRREAAARRLSSPREWAPAILATFFTGR